MVETDRITSTTPTLTTITTQHEAAAPPETGERLSHPEVSHQQVDHGGNHKLSIFHILPIFVFARISVREATPDHEKHLYNYNYKDKWDQSLAQAGMSSSLNPEDVQTKQKTPRRKFNSFSSRNDSLGMRIYLYIFVF